MFYTLTHGADAEEIRRIEANAARIEAVQRLDNVLESWVDISWECQLDTGCLDEYRGVLEELHDKKRELDDLDYQLGWAENYQDHRSACGIAGQMERLEREIRELERYRDRWDWDECEREIEVAEKVREAIIAKKSRDHARAQLTMRAARCRRRVHVSPSRGRQSHRRVVVRVAAKLTSSSSDPDPESSTRALRSSAGGVA